MKRRQFLEAGLAAAAAAGMAGARSAFAQESKRLVVTNWGGDWNDRTVKFIEQPLLEEKGWQIVRDLNEQPQRKTKLLAERRLPRGTVDVAHFDIAEATALNAADVLDTIDYAKMPNAKALVETLKRPFFMPWLYSAWELVYNPDKVHTPDSYAVLWDPRYAGRVGVMDQNYQSAMQVASVLGSGKMDDFAATQKKLLEWKKAVQPKVYPSHQQAAAALQSGDIWVIGNFRARGLQWQHDGINVRTAYPKEGGLSTCFGTVLPKRSSNKEGALVYMNALLDPEHLKNLCSANFYAPANTAVAIPGEVGQKIAYTPEQLKTLRSWDYDFWTANQPKWLEWWKKEFLA